MLFQQVTALIHWKILFLDNCQLTKLQITKINTS